MSAPTAVLLAGGLGTRLRAAVPELPKILAPVLGRPVVTYLLDGLERAGIRRVVVCTGYRADDVERALGPRYGELELVYSRETSPLGTGGAARLALPWIATETALVLNGDSYCEVDLPAMLAAHRGGATMLLTRHAKGRAFGSVDVDDSGKITRFREKSEDSGAFINAGVYLMDRAALAAVSAGRTVSFEHDVFPALVARGELHGFRGGGRFLDIGTPDTYAAAGAFFDALGLVRRRWALVDRDGTIIVNHDHLTDPAKVELLPGAAEALRLLRARGLAIGVVTNQSVIGRGRLDEAGLAKIHRRMLDLLEAEGVRVEEIVHCPHAPDAGCECRKPKTALVERIARDRPLDASASFVIGDDWKDIALGKSLGATTLLVRTGHGRGVEASSKVTPDHVCDDLLAAARLVAGLV